MMWRSAASCGKSDALSSTSRGYKSNSQRRAGQRLAAQAAERLIDSLKHEVAALKAVIARLRAQDRVAKDVTALELSAPQSQVAEPVVSASRATTNPLDIFRGAVPPPPKGLPPEDGLCCFLGEVWDCSILETHVLKVQAKRRAYVLRAKAPVFRPCFCAPLDVAPALREGGSL